MKKLLLILSVSLSFTASSQIVWGAGSTNPNYDNAGRFATAFGSPNGWTAVGVSSPTALWTRTMNGLTQGAYANGQPPIGSPSQTDGVALYDSDFMDNGGVTGAFGLGTCPSPHKGDLVSPSFDLTGYTDASIQAKMFLRYRNFQIVALSVGFSSDGGATYTDFSISQGVATNAIFNGAFISVPLTGVTNGVTNLTDCKMRLTFDGDYYYAMIDDISLEVLSPYDFTIAAANPASNLASELGEQVLITNNRYYPLSQLEGANLFFGANVKNLGVIDALPVDNVKLNLTIQQYTGTWNTVYNQFILIDTVLADNYGTLNIDTLTNTNWLQVGDFRAIYSISSDVTDAVTTNDSVMHYFTINNNEYASKVELNVQNKPLITTNLSAGSTNMAVEYGSIYSFPKGGDSNLKIDSVSFSYTTTAGFIGSSSQTVRVNIYEWNDLNLNFVLNDLSELNKIGSADVTLNGLSAGNNYTSTVSGFLNPNTSNPMSALQNNKFYFVSVLIDQSLFGGPGTFNANDVISYGASENQNYSLNNISDDNSIPSPVLVTDAAGTTSVYGIGFGNQYSPSFGLHLSGCNPTTGTDVISSCTSITWIDGLSYSSNNNTATHTLSSIAGCDSTVTLNLTILPAVNATTTTTAETITANATGVTYQWIDCATNTAITNETNQSFTATANGNYAVVVNDGNCSDTSSCVTIASVGIKNINSNNLISIQPNPNNGSFTIKAPVKGNYTIVNELGQVIQYFELNNTNNYSVSMSELAKGVYFVIGTDNNFRSKIVVTK